MEYLKRRQKRALKKCYRERLKEDEKMRGYCGDERNDGKCDTLYSLHGSHRGEKIESFAQR